MVAVALVVFALQFLDMQAVIKGLGDLVVSLGGYLAARFLIPDRETVRARGQGAGRGLRHPGRLHGQRTVHSSECV